MVFLWTSLWTSYLRFMLIGNYNGFVVDMHSLGQANLHFSEELQCFRGGHGFCETVRSESNRPRVLREQKVLPEVRNGPLLLREIFSFSTFEKLLRIQWGILPFYPFNFRCTYKTKLVFEKMSQLEVGVLWIARRYRFSNLRFKHRGMQLGM